MLFYEQSTGTLYRDTGEVLGVGFAGHGEGKNNPAMQAVVGVGPLPVGVYQIGVPIDHPRLGPVAMRLTQIGGQSYGRAGFFIHGDSSAHPGESSDGCIVLERAVREAVAALCANSPSILVVLPTPQRSIA